MTDDVQEVPWTTASDLVDDALDSLGVPEDSKTAELAREYAQRYSVDEPIGRQPSSVAAGSIYLASMFDRDRRVTHADLRGALGVWGPTITGTYQEIAEAEGIPIAGRSEDRPEPQQRSYVRALLDRLGFSGGRS